MNILRISNPQKLKKKKKKKEQEPQTGLLGLTKKDCISFVNAMNSCCHHLENTLTSSSHSKFRLDIFGSKHLLHFLGGEKTV